MKNYHLRKEYAINLLSFSSKHLREPGHQEGDPHAVVRGSP